MTEAVNAARAQIAAGEAEVAAGRLALNAALAAMADSGMSAAEVAEAVGVGKDTAKNAIAAHRKLVPKPVDTRPPLRDRPKGSARPTLQFETHPSMPGMVRPIVGRPVAPPEPTEARVWDREPEAPEPAPPEPNPNPTEVDFWVWT